MVRMALISDIHFGELSRTEEFAIPGESTKDKTQGAVSLSESLINILKEQDVQYLFIAGDLTSRGSPHEFRYCEEKIIAIAEAAGISRENLIWGMGNHDVDWKISELHAHEKYNGTSPAVQQILQEKYGTIAASVAISNIDKLPKEPLVGPVPVSGVFENETFIAIVLNSSICCTHDQKVKHGKLTEKQLNWLRKLAVKYRTDTRWKFILMHHHPYNYTYHVPGLDISMIEEGSEFTEIAAEMGVDAILHGHRHHPWAETVQKGQWNKPMTFICAGSLTVNAEHRSNGDVPNTFHIIELADTVGILRLFNYEYSTSRGWIPLETNKPETPLDSEMRYGKVILESEMNEKILLLGQHEEQMKEIGWESVEEDLHFWSIKRINEKISELLSGMYEIAGEFPKSIYLIRRKEEDTNGAAS